MNSFALAFVVVHIVALLVLPRRWAVLPFLTAACYMSYTHVINVGPFHFNIVRLLTVSGLIRKTIRGERIASPMNILDRLMLAWGSELLLVSLLHAVPADSFVNNLGFAFDTCGVYFLFRTFCRSWEDVLKVCAMAAIVLLPLAFEMTYEKTAYFNVFQSLAGDPQSIEIREGKIRANGVFGHAILAGTVGGILFAFMVPLWRSHRKVAMIGMGACVTIVMCSASSGPIMSLICGVVALFMWRIRFEMQTVRRLMVACYIGLYAVMKDPPYYLLARVDLVGGSTGWHRARLIQSAFEHLSEWWFVGTDYTRHWMVLGISATHADITNHYILVGVKGGLAAMLLFIAILSRGFSFVGKTQRQELSEQRRWLSWALGAMLFAHAASFVSVAYFDQSFVFLDLTLAAICSVYCAAEVKRTTDLPLLTGTKAPDWNQTKTTARAKIAV